MSLASCGEGAMAEEKQCGGGVRPAASASAARATVERLARAAEEVATVGDCRSAYKKQLCSLSRWIKLLGPMFDELRDSRDPIPDEAAPSLAPLLAALASAKALTRLAGEGSNIFLVLEREKINKGFQEITSQLDQALEGISLEKLDLSDEVREQVELVHVQLKRAKARDDFPDIELYNDLSSIYDKGNDACVDPAVLRRLAEKLQLTTIADLKHESLALHELVVSSDGRDPGERIEKISMLLKKIKDFVLTQNPEMGAPTNLEAFVVSNCKAQSPFLPDDYRCPISLELMEDPVIVSSGQTYDRACIEKWIQSGHDTCPKTQQKLLNTSLTPNYALRSLICQWCEANGVEPPRRPALPAKPSLTDRAGVSTLVRMLTSSDPEERRLAAGELRLLAKRSSENRLCIAEAGAIPLLGSLLTVADSRAQEHAVTALLNLSICEQNKARIITSRALPGIVHVLRHGSMEARENAAATLFSLSVVDENKVTIGSAGAIPALIKLLKEGSPRGKKDAATAIFNLCIYQGNKGKAIRAGVVPTLMQMLTEPAGGMTDEALAIMAVLSTHPEGKAVIGATNAVPVLVEVLGSGSPRNRENAAAVLVHLCGGGEQQQKHLAVAQECGLVPLLLELASNGTERGKRKAVQLLERVSRYLDQQKQAVPQEGEAVAAVATTAAAAVADE